MAEPTGNENDISSLRADVARLTKIVSAQSAEAYSDVRNRAAKVADAAAPAVRKAADVAKSEGSAIAQTARDHPAAAGSVVFLAATIGIFIGYVIGSASQPEPPRRRYLF